MEVPVHLVTLGLNGMISVFVRKKMVYSFLFLRFPPLLPLLLVCFCIDFLSHSSVNSRRTGMPYVGLIAGPPESGV